ncbi:MAG: hypothetical protein HYR48_05965, partial [Gemmatimonadetes bacterium]|nr:hypothetical protein [Gemmatimonadota bacterium]
MRLRRARALPAVLTLFLLLIIGQAGSLRAQGARDSLVSGHRAYDRADFAGAARLIAIGLDPAAGPRDSLWIAAVHKLTDALLVLQHDSLADVWLRWANRVAPDFGVDSLTFPPRVTSAILAARAAIRATPDDSLAETSYEFTGETSPGRGVLRVQRGTVNFLAVIDSLATALPDERMTLAAGIHTIRVSADGHRPVRLAREVLPGVTTVIRVRLQRPGAAPAVPAATASTPAANVAGPMLSAGGAATCSAGSSGATFC